MNRPSFQFYPSDWYSNTKLRRCNFHLRGIWMELLCLFHDSEEYGILRWTLEEIANTVGCKKKDLEDLIRFGILKGSEKDGDKVSFSTLISKRNAHSEEKFLIKNEPTPLFYSSRMVRDEFIRNERGKVGYLSQLNKNVPKKKDGEKERESDIEKDTLFPSSSPSPTSSSSEKHLKKEIQKKKKLDSYSEDFLEFWKKYPRKVGKDLAFKSWKKQSPPLAKCLETLEWQVKSEQWTKDGGEFIPHPATWLNQGRWNDEPLVANGNGNGSHFLSPEKRPKFTF